jgi:asparagine synthase (glutamine-hydrolysing)
MCGFIGVLRRDGSMPEETRLESALEYLRPRGPDAVGRWQEPGVAFGHRRLAVIDLDAKSNQPIVSADGRYVIVFNGEIYNYKALRAEPAFAGISWRTQGDTEVILAAYAAWGKNCVVRFEGMFAFAIWDRERRELFAARDRLGVKPFYYSHSSSGLAFGSRPRAVRMAESSGGPSIDREAICAYLDLGFFPAPCTALINVRKLPPASRMFWRDGEVAVERYWSPSDESTHRPRDPEREVVVSLDALEKLVLEAVESRLVSDVPVGAFLSGGIDSSVVVAAMARLCGGAVSTFTIGFSDSESDESERAKAVAHRLGVRNTSEIFAPADLLKLFPVFLRAFDEPFFDSSAFPLMAVSSLARQSVTVALSGDGGDELFGGYTYYQWMRWFRATDRLGALPRRALARALALSGNARAAMAGGAISCPDPVARYAYLRGIRKDLPDVVDDEVRLASRGGLHWVRSAAASVRRAPDDAGFWAEVDKLLILPDDYLQKVDVASMAFSLEVREPMLATSLVEWSSHVPGRVKVGWLHGKQLLRALAVRWVGADLQDRTKRGFSVPIAPWLRGDLKSWGAQLCHDSAALQTLGLRPERVQALWNLHQSGRRNVHSYLWAILMLVAWYREERSIGSNSQ